MDRPLITVPRGLFRMTSADWDIDWREQVSGQATSGRRNIVMGKLPRWVGAPSLVFRPELIPQWRAHRWAGRGLTAVFRITMLDVVSFDHPAPAPTPFEDEALFDDNAAWDVAYQLPCVGGAAPGDSEITVDESAAVQPVAVGQILSHGDWPFAVTWREDLGGGQVRLGVEMPIRSPIPDGGLIDMEGVGLFEAVNPRAANPGYDIHRVARTEFALQEWLR